MPVALKVDVDTYRGTREGVPRLVEALRRHGARATFLFSLGPDHTGWAIRRVFRPGFLAKASRTSVLEHYGLRTLLYGTLLPGPDIGRRCGDVMRAVHAAGFEVGIHSYDHVKWQDGVAHRDPAWTETEMNRARNRFLEILGFPAVVHGAAGWQMNAHAYVHEQACGFRYASDVRGQTPFLPVIHGRCVPVPQLPTTLPTLDEVLGRDGITADTLHEHMAQQTAAPGARPHVYTAHAELEGMKLLPSFERMLESWRGQGHKLVSLGDVFATLDLARLPRHRVMAARVPGRSGTLAVQGPAPEPETLRGG